MRAAADRMITLTHAIRGAYTTTGELTAARAAAVAAHDDFVDTGARYLRPTQPYCTPEQEIPR
ncbi:hypothetical protein [Streptomyces sp. MNP-20]|uniref:hypothetical protein n=1 Tax=Streptomyces sp. MNP-20 TaxID=2721165 RepID=UPI0020A6D8E0|nr:hypothetical protein [Streptomyces sp. MNP-20]